MRSELHEPSRDGLAVRTRHDLGLHLAAGVKSSPTNLEPTAVDAALADESMPMLTVCGKRRDRAATNLVNSAADRIVDDRRKASAIALYGQSSGHPRFDEAVRN